MLHSLKEGSLVKVSFDVLIFHPLQYGKTYLVKEVTNYSVLLEGLNRWYPYYYFEKS